MTLTIDIDPELEARLKAAAQRENTDAAAFACRVLAEHIPPLEPGAATLALFEQWDMEDETDDPEEIARRNHEWEEFKENISATRETAGARRIYP